MYVRVGADCGYAVYVSVIEWYYYLIFVSHFLYYIGVI